MKAGKAGNLLYASAETAPGDAVSIEPLSGGTHIYIGVQAFSAPGSDPFDGEDPLRVDGAGTFSIEIKTTATQRWQPAPAGQTTLDLGAPDTNGIDFMPYAVRVTPAGAAGMDHYRLVISAHLS